MKERYNVAPWNDGKDAVCKAEDGKYILYTDHLAEIREIVDTYDLLIDQCDKKNSELEDERDGYRNGQQQVQDLLAKQIDNSLKLAAENKRLREALEKLARLGNEPMLGNSVGNIIAQEALKEASHESK